MDSSFDVIVMGGGTAGLPAAYFAAGRGAKVLLVEAAEKLGGTLWYSSAQMSAAGTRLQKQQGIEDHPDKHYADAWKIGRGKQDPALLRLHVDTAAESFDWLMDVGYRPAPGMPMLMPGHELYDVPRTVWATTWGVELRETLTRIVQKPIESGAITLMLGTCVVALLPGKNGAIEGVEIETADGVRRSIKAKNVVLAAGGYAGSEETFKRFHPNAHLFTGGWQHNTGLGILLGLEAGGVLRGADDYMPNFGGLWDGEQNPPRWLINPGAVAGFRPIIEIYVNEKGERFVAEDGQSPDAKERLLMQQPGWKFWAVFDEECWNRAENLFRVWDDARVERAFASNHNFHRAPTARALAQAAGFDADNFEKTLAAYNAQVEQGSDPLGRKIIGPKLGRGPWRAIANCGITIWTFAGLRANAQLQVTRADGSAVPNLYAIGDVLGGSTFSGNGFCGGMGVTPAVNFGRLVGKKFLSW